MRVTSGWTSALRTEAVAKKLQAPSMASLLVKARHGGKQYQWFLGPVQIATKQHVTKVSVQISQGRFLENIRRLPSVVAVRKWLQQCCSLSNNRPISILPIRAMSIQNEYVS